MIYAKNDLSIKRIQLIKDATKRKILQKATNNWQKPVTDFVLREVVFGDTSCTDVYDMVVATAVNGTAGIPVWGFSTDDLAINSLKTVITAGSTVDDNKTIGICGYFDIAPEEGYAGTTGVAACVAPPAGNVTAIEFKRGSSVLDLWKVSHLYAHDEVVGFSDTPVIWEENESYDVLVNPSYDEDVQAGLIGYVCEPIGLGHLNPTSSMDVMARAEHGVTNVSHLSQEQQIQAVMRAGMDPVQEMDADMIGRLYDRAKLGLYSLIVESGQATSIADARKNYYVRHFHAADNTMADPYLDVDLETSGGAATAHWEEVAADLTLGDLDNIFATGQTVNDRDFVALFGMVDRATNSAMLSVAPGDGGGNLDFCDVQRLYAYHGDISGYTQRITYYRQNASISYKMCVGVARGQYAIPTGLIAEPYGSVVSQT